MVRYTRSEKTANVWKLLEDRMNQNKEVKHKRRLRKLDTLQKREIGNFQDDAGEWGATMVCRGQLVQDSRK